MFRDDRQMAMNDLLMRCEDAAERYRVGAHMAENEQLVDGITRLAEERETFGRRLREEIRRLDDLPQDDDADKETLEDLFTLFKAKLGTDADQVIREEVVTLETALRSAASQARDVADLPQQALDLLTELQAAAERAIAQYGPAGDSSPSP